MWFINANNGQNSSVAEFEVNVSQTVAISHDTFQMWWDFDDDYIIKYAGKSSDVVTSLKTSFGKNSLRAMLYSDIFWLTVISRTAILQELTQNILTSRSLILLHTCKY